MVKGIGLEPAREEIGIRISHGEEKKREKGIVFTLVGLSLYKMTQGWR